LKFSIKHVNNSAVSSLRYICCSTFPLWDSSGPETGRHMGFT